MSSMCDTWNCAMSKNTCIHLSQKSLTSKVHMRLALPSSSEELWDSFKAKVRNQVRKGEKQGFRVQWGGEALLRDFYDVFSRNMREFGDPPYSGKRLFRGVLRHSSQNAEFCVLKLASKPIAAAILIHGATVTEVPSASSLRNYNSTNANMYMYWQLLQRAIERRRQWFDFGRSTIDSGTYHFKKQWGAQPVPAIWQYHVRHGSVDQLRPENRKYRLAVRVWRRLPVALTRLIGPTIVRGIP